MITYSIKLPDTNGSYTFTIQNGATKTEVADTFSKLQKLFRSLKPSQKFELKVTHEVTNSDD